MRRLKWLVRGLLRKTKTLLRLLRRLLIKRPPDFYEEKERKLSDLGLEDKAIGILKRGLEFYPNHPNLHKRCAIYAMHNKSWKEAVFHWDYVLKSEKNKLLPEYYLECSKALKADNQINKSITTLESGFEKFPTNIEIIILLSNLLTEKRDWKKASAVLVKLFEIESIYPPIESYIHLSTLYTKQGLYSRAEYILQICIKLNPKNKEALNNYANIAIQRKNWVSAIQRLEYISELYDKNIPFDVLVNLTMLHYVVGNRVRANGLLDQLLDTYPNEVKEDKKGYRKLTLFDNGETRIEFYKKIKRVNKVVVTFDSLNMVWDNPPFGFKLLVEENVDILAIRKKRKKRYHQDLSLDEFLDVTKYLANCYKDKIAYGFSLGAYSALYYGAALNCRILALAPRLSIHPIYGKGDVISKFDFKHNLSHDFNDEISPIIVYDPKDKQDNTYIENEIVRSFPNARFIELKYGGHEVAPNLLRMGVLKNFILTVINGREMPKYDRRLKAKATNYCRILGRACLERNKLKWAKDLSEMAVQLSPKNRHAIRFKVDVLRKLNQYNDAIEYIEEIIKLLPGMLAVRLILIDLYIQTHDLIIAEKELNIAIEQFGERPSLLNKKKLIDEERELIINIPLKQLVQ